MSREIDPRALEREPAEPTRGGRGGASPLDGEATATGLDPLTVELDLPRGPSRERVHALGRDYWLSGRDVETLAAVGAFRVVPSHTLHPAPARTPSRPARAIERLRDDGLLQTTPYIVGRTRTTLVTLTDQGRALLERHQRPEGRQAYYAGINSPRRVAHDARDHGRPGAEVIDPFAPQVLDSETEPVGTLEEEIGASVDAGAPGIEAKNGRLGDQPNRPGRGAQAQAQSAALHPTAPPRDFRVERLDLEALTGHHSPLLGTQVGGDGREGKASGSEEAHFRGGGDADEIVGILKPLAQDVRSRRHLALEVLGALARFVARRIAFQDALVALQHQDRVVPALVPDLGQAEAGGDVIRVLLEDRAVLALCLLGPVRPGQDRGKLGARDRILGPGGQLVAIARDRARVIPPPAVQA